MKGRLIAGAGIAAATAAWWLTDSAPYPIVDIQAEMLDCVTRRAVARNIDGIVPVRADARELPLADASFDAAYLVTALGEMPDPPTVLRELRRVLKPSGRLVVGEFFDRHFVPRVTLLRQASTAGFHPGMMIGPPLAYFARLQCAART